MIRFIRAKQEQKSMLTMVLLFIACVMIAAALIGTFRPSKGNTRTAVKSKRTRNRGATTGKPPMRGSSATRMTSTAQVGIRKPWGW
jgi:hypothetical protein